MICHCNNHSLSFPSSFHFQGELTPVDENVNLDSTFLSPPDVPLRRPVSDLHVYSNDHDSV